MIDSLLETMQRNRMWKVTKRGLDESKGAAAQRSNKQCHSKLLVLFTIGYQHLWKVEINGSSCSYQESSDEICALLPVHRVGHSNYDTF